MKYGMGFLFLLCSMVSVAQTDSSKMSHKKVARIPAFDLLETDSSTHLTREMLKKDCKTLLMFFSPDCPHCQHETEEMLAAMDSLKDVQILMVTNQSFEEMVDFYKRYQLANYPSIKVARDTRFSLPPLYGMTMLPYLALYNEKGMLITTFDGGQSVAKIYATFNSNKK